MKTEEKTVKEIMDDKDVKEKQEADIKKHREKEHLRDFVIWLVQNGDIAILVDDKPCTDAGEIKKIVSETIEQFHKENPNK